MMFSDVVRVPVAATSAVAVIFSRDLDDEEVSPVGPPICPGRKAKASAAGKLHVVKVAMNASNMLE